MKYEARSWNYLFVALNFAPPLFVFTPKQLFSTSQKSSKEPKIRFRAGLPRKKKEVPNAVPLRVWRHRIQDEAAHAIIGRLHAAKFSLWSSKPLWNSKSMIRNATIHVEEHF